MKQLLKRPRNIFFILIFALGLPLFLFPINLFKGEEVREKEVFGKMVEIKTPVPLSLSYFIGIGYEEEDLIGVKDFYLLPEGYLLAFLFIFGVPALIAYRVYIGQKAKEVE
jgi:hypothetical protein